MAACRGWRLMWPGRRWFSQDPSVPPPAPAPAPLYPPIVASHTAKSKAAKRRRLELFYQQTFALNADRWYRSFTKTAFVPGLPPAPPPAAAKAPEARAGSAEALQQGTTAEALQQGTTAEALQQGTTAEALQQGTTAASGPGAAAPGAGGSMEPPAEAAAELDMGALRDLACDALLQESFYQNKKRPFLYRDQDHTPAPFLTQLVSSLAAFLCKRNPLLAASSMDLNPEVNYYWHHGEEVVVHGHRKGRVDPVRFQIDDKPHLQIRVPKQLPEIVPLESDLGDVPVIDHKPSKLPLFKKQYENKVFIGSKVADPCCYGHTQFHLIPDKLKRQRFIVANLEDQIEVVYRANGIASLFAWTAAQAMYQGFWNEADVTRPFVSQAVVTDGKYFAFFCYQLNTLALTAETIQKSSRKNICWGTDSKPLYDVVEDGSVKGFNDEVLLQLVGFLLNRPKEL
uniref:Mitochondrial ribosomal protein S30 n=1 Tax=Coturnix japonica TaxID=93934 RepID=A0A8C2TKH5_COTJA